MRRTFTHSFLNLLLAVAVVGVVCAQNSEAQNAKEANMESHIGKLTGHAARRRYAIPQVLRRVPWGDRKW